VQAELFELCGREGGRWGCSFCSATCTARRKKTYGVAQRMLSAWRGIGGYQHQLAAAAKEDGVGAAANNGGSVFIDGVSSIGGEMWRQRRGGSVSGSFVAAASACRGAASLAIAA